MPELPPTAEIAPPYLTFNNSIRTFVFIQVFGCLGTAVQMTQIDLTSDRQRIAA